jgi:hypothetical protein
MFLNVCWISINYGDVTAFNGKRKEKNAIRAECDIVEEREEQKRESTCFFLYHV